MKYPAIVVIINLSLGLGHFHPAEFPSFGSRGLICKIDDKGHTLECDEENSQLPEDLKIKSAVETNEFACLDITYKTGFLWKKTHHVMQCAYQLKGQRLCTVLTKNNDVSKCSDYTPDIKPYPVPSIQTDSGLYCIADDLDNTVECSKSNSILPTDLDDGTYQKNSEYVCLDITYRTGLILPINTKHVRQCTLKLTEDDLCDVLKNRNNVPSCSQSIPYSSRTISPPSGLYCEVGSSGPKVECSKANSILPTDLNIGSAKQSGEYICLSVMYKTGLIIQKSHSTVQCAPKLKGDKDLCSVLQNENNIRKCWEWRPCEYASDSIQCHQSRTTFPDEEGEEENIEVLDPYYEE